MPNVSDLTCPGLLLDIGELSRYVNFRDVRPRELPIVHVNVRVKAIVLTTVFVATEVSHPDIVALSYKYKRDGVLLSITKPTVG